jgi:hypothetical protein
MILPTFPIAPVACLAPDGCGGFSSSFPKLKILEKKLPSTNVALCKRKEKENKRFTHEDRNMVRVFDYKKDRMI